MIYEKIFRLMLRTRPSCTRPSCMCSTRPPQDGDTHQPNYYH